MQCCGCGANYLDRIEYEKCLKKHLLDFKELLVRSGVKYPQEPIDQNLTYHLVMGGKDLQSLRDFVSA